MNIVLRKTGAPLSPSSCQRDSQRIQDRGLARVVRTDEHCRRPQVDSEMPYRPEVLDLDPRYAHSPWSLRPLSAMPGPTRRTRHNRRVWDALPQKRGRASPTVPPVGTGRLLQGIGGKIVVAGSHDLPFRVIQMAGRILDHQRNGSGASSGSQTTYSQYVSPSCCALYHSLVVSLTG